MNLDINDYDEFAALADTIKLEEITLSKREQDVLRRLRGNDLQQLWICGQNYFGSATNAYSPDRSKELACLGYYLGQSTSVKALYVTCILCLFLLLQCHGMRG